MVKIGMTKNKRNQKQRRKTRDGQVMTTDFMLASIILIFVISMVMFAWNRSVYLLREKNERTELRRLGLSISGILVRSPGVPDDWDRTNVMTVGLVRRLNVLDDSKITEFLNMPKNQIQDLLGIRGFDFSFRVRAVNDTILYDYGSNPSGLKDVIVTRRLVMLDSEVVYVEFGLWRE